MSTIFGYADRVALRDSIVIEYSFISTCSGMMWSTSRLCLVLHHTHLLLSLSRTCCLQSRSSLRCLILVLSLTAFHFHKGLLGQVGFELGNLSSMLLLIRCLRTVSLLYQTSAQTSLSEYHSVYSSIIRLMMCCEIGIIKNLSTHCKATDQRHLIMSTQILVGRH